MNTPKKDKSKLKHLTALELALISLLVISVVSIGLIVNHYRHQSLLDANAGNLDFQSIGTAVAPKHSVNFGACRVVDTPDVWTIKSLAAISPALPPKNDTSGYTWYMKAYSSAADTTLTGIISSSDWWDGVASEIQLTVNPNTTNFIQYSIIGAKPVFQINADQIQLCTPPTPPTNPTPPTKPKPPTPQPVNPVSLETQDNRGLSSAFFGYSMDEGASGALDDPAVATTAASLGMENLRIYGGSFGNVWNWQSGHYITNVPDLNPDKPTIPLTLTNVLNVAKTAKATPLFMMNIMTDTLSHQLELLSMAQKDGVQIKYIELGNELYFNDPKYIQYFPTVQSYISKANTWITAIRQVYPGVEIAVPGQYISNNPAYNAIPRNATWMASLIAGVHGENAVTFHIYFDSGVTGGNVNIPGNVGGFLSKSASAAYAQTQAAVSQLPGNLSAWVTEWNMDDLTALIMGSWTQGLVEATYEMDLLNNPKIELNDNYSLLASQAWGALFSNTDAYVGDNNPLDFDDFRLPSPKPATQYLGKTAGGFTLSALARSLKGAGGSTPLQFIKNPLVQGADGLLGREFTVNGKDNLYFVNLTDTQQVVTIPSSIGSSFSLEQYYTRANNFVTGNSSVSSNKGTVHSQLVMPAYSVSSLVNTD